MKSIEKINISLENTGENEYWRIQLYAWTKEFIPDYYMPVFSGFKDLGKSTRGQCAFYGPAYGDGIEKPRYGVITMSNRLKSDWRIKATLWHEFCHHWEWVETGEHGHGKGFDARVRRKPVLWILCAISRCLPLHP